MGFPLSPSGYSLAAYRTTSRPGKTREIRDIREHFIWMLEWKIALGNNRFTKLIQSRAHSHNIICYHFSAFSLQRRPQGEAEKSSSPPPNSQKFAIGELRYFPELDKMTDVLDIEEKWVKLNFPIRFSYVSFKYLSRIFRS